jgi:hypothetical protein
VVSTGQQVFRRIIEPGEGMWLDEKGVRNFEDKLVTMSPRKTSVILLLGQVFPIVRISVKGFSGLRTFCLARLENHLYGWHVFRGQRWTVMFDVNAVLPATNGARY